MFDRRFDFSNFNNPIVGNWGSYSVISILQMHKFGSYFPQTYLYQNFIAKTGQNSNQNEINYPQAHLSNHLICFAAGARKQDQKLSRMKIKAKR